MTTDSVTWRHPIYCSCLHIICRSMLLSKADYEQRTILYLLVGLFLYWVWDGSWWVADDTGYVRSFELLGGCHLCLLTQIFNLHINTQNIDFRFYWHDDISTRYWGTIHKRRRQNSGIFSPPSHHFCQIPPPFVDAPTSYGHTSTVSLSSYTSSCSQYSQYRLKIVTTVCLEKIRMAHSRNLS